MLNSVPSATLAVVIGAGPVGLITAAYLARRGYRVGATLHTPVLGQLGQGWKCVDGLGPGVAAGAAACAGADAGAGAGAGVSVGAGAALVCPSCLHVVWVLPLWGCCLCAGAVATAACVQPALMLVALVPGLTHSNPPSLPCTSHTSLDPPLLPPFRPQPS